MKASFSFLRRYVVLLAFVALSGGCGGGSDPSSPVSSALRVACVGDSITEGTGTNNPQTEAYPAVLGQLLGRDYQVQNFGVGGTTLLDAGRASYRRQSAFSDALRFKPDIVIVALGTNDRGQVFDEATKTRFASDYKTLIAAFKNASPNAKVYVCLPPPSFPTGSRLSQTLVQDVLPLIQQVAQSTGSQVIDFYTPLSAHPEWFPDGVHPTPPGAQLLASQVGRALTGKPSVSG